MTRVYFCSSLILRILVVAGYSEYAVYCFDVEFSLMFFNKDIFYFRRFAKYVAVFWRIVSFLFRFVSWRLRRVISVDIFSLRLEDVC